MRTAAPNWLLAAKRAATVGRLSASYEPIYLIELLGINRHFTTRRFVPTGPRTLGDGWTLGSGLLLGAVHAAYELDLVADSLREWHVELSETDGTVRLSGTQLDLLSDAAFLATMNARVLDQCAVRIRLGFLGLGHSEYLAMWRGVVDRTQDQDLRLNLDLIDGSLLKHRNLSVPIGGQYFPGAPQASRNSHIPLLIGINVDAPAIQIAGPAAGSLGLPLSAGGTELFLTEYGASFPSAGQISVGSESGVTYASREVVTLLGRTYLRLSGLTRGGPALQPVASSVTLSSVQYVYLIGYQVSSLQAVRNNGVLVNPVNYVLSTLQADRPVSVLTFATQQGDVTVDTNAANLVLDTLLTNGGFETGTTAGWVIGPGATAVVGTTTPDPREGTYRLGVTGAQNAYRDVYQEWPTVPGEEYRVLYAYQTEKPGNVATNGGFESGVLSPWVVVASQNDPRYEVAHDGNAAEGAMVLAIRPRAGGQGVHPDYTLTLSLDATVTNGLAYAFSFAYKTQRMVRPLYFGNYGDSGETALSYQVGTPANPQAYVPLTPVPTAWYSQVSPQLGILAPQPNPALTYYGPVNQGGGGLYGGLIPFAKSQAHTLVASGTTVRMTFTFTGTIAGPTFYQDAYTLLQGAALDAVQLALTPQTESEAALQLGTPTLPGTYADVTLNPSLNWSSSVRTFRATGTTARLTLRSRHTNAPAQVYWDDLAVYRYFTIHAGSGGQNPVEAMAYIIDTFLPQYTRDAASFTAAYSRLEDWRFGAVLSDPGDSRALLQRMAQQCNSLLFEDADGVLKLVVRDASRPVEYGFDSTNIVEDSYRPLSESSDNVATSVYVYFGAKTGGSTSPGDFQGVTYATPTESTHPGGATLSALCARALSTYRRERRLDVFADFVVDFETANFLLDATVRDRTQRHHLVTFDTWLDAAPVELGDVVQVVDPRTPHSPPITYELIGPGLVPNDPVVRLLARTLTQAGWSAPFDYSVTLLPLGGWSAPFEYQLSTTYGAGWSAEFDVLEPLYATQADPEAWQARVQQRRRRLPGGSTGPIL